MPRQNAYDLNATPPPLAAHQELGLVGAPRGQNLFEVRDVRGDVTLLELPARFRRSVWIRRGSYVIMDRSASSAGQGTKIGGEIVLPLSAQQVREMRKEGRWPKEFDVKTTQPHGQDEKLDRGGTGDEERTGRESDDDGDDLFMANPNHRRRAAWEEEEEESEEEEGDDDDMEGEQEQSAGTKVAAA